MKAKLSSVRNLVPDLVYRLLEDLNTPRALAVYLLYRSGKENHELKHRYENNEVLEHDQLLALEMPDPASYDSLSTFADDYQATSLLSKYPFLITSHNRKEVAIKKFWASEEQCRLTNRRILSMHLTPDSIETGPFHSVFHEAREIIRHVLGPLNMSQMIDSCGWGPGVSSSCKGNKTSVYNKFQAKLEATPDLIACDVHHVINAWHPWASFHNDASDDTTGVSYPSSITASALISRPGNKLAFVPKNAKTDRPIAVEPHVNSFLQKGIGTVMRGKLKRAGLDLDHGQDRNRHFAQIGSRDGSYATIDLSAASDTVSVELVRALLPADWFVLMDVARSKLGSFENKWFRYHKFSSMGNGFTFELESLIFWALSLAVLRRHNLDSDVLAVFGDDIIVPTQCTEEVLRVLTYAGFTPNPDKTFTQGPFRESCGKDYISGTLVRPFFLKEEVADVLSIYRVANALRRYSAMRCSNLGCDGRFRSTWNFLFRQVPKAFQLRIPDGYGDGGFVSNFDEACPVVGSSTIPAPKRAKDGIEGFLTRMWLSHATTGRVEFVSLGTIFSTLISKESASRGRFNYRNLNFPKLKLVLVKDWSDLGPWY